MMFESSPSSIASRDLSREWRSCCLRAGGWDEMVLDAPIQNDEPDDGPNNAGSTANLISLVDFFQDKPKTGVEKERDGWISAMREIEKNLDRMIAWLQEKKWTYVAVETPDEEASLIQSTIASYTASTANELEELRTVLIAQQRQEYTDRPQTFEHHTIMAQTLLERLKWGVAEPFGKLQKQRHREAVKLWQNPLRVELYIPPLKDIDEIDAALGLAPEEPALDHQFTPRRPLVPLHQDFMSSYGTPDTAPLEPPESLFAKRSKRDPVSPTGSASQAKPPEKRFKPLQAFGFQQSQQKPTLPPEQQHHHHNEGMYADPEPQELQQEAVLLKASLENDLDQVQKMETTMVAITKLLSQFADLVANQQEDIIQIHDAAETTKSNMEKGQEKLLDAADQTHNSHHYMATAIAAMGVMLLVVHWIRP
eukprot:scaffold184_cov179-Amphora_coffeaeformis.AAC.15